MSSSCNTVYYQGLRLHLETKGLKKGTGERKVSSSSFRYYAFEQGTPTCTLPCETSHTDNTKAGFSSRV